VRYVAPRVVPFILIYALYVLAHGDFGPGGGFQGGVIFAAGLVLLALANGWAAGRDRIPEVWSDSLLPAGALFYAGIGLGSLIVGEAFLQYEAYAGSAGDAHAKHFAHHLGLIGIETGVMITVSAAMVTLFFEMGRPKRYIDVPRRPRERRGPSRGSGGE
jgi:multicomponent Na+:H+ antiporter subunit B